MTAGTKIVAAAVATTVVAAAVVVFVVVPWLSFKDPAQAVSTSQPAVAPLMIPPLLSGERVDGVVHFDLSIAPDAHAFLDDVATETFSYNGQGVLGPTLEVQEGDEVVIDVTNDLDEVTTTHWHGADVPAVADGGPHSTIQPGETWQARFPVIQPAATLWYHPHRKDITAEHVYNGGAGLLLIRDDNPLAEGLPQTYGVDDIPLVLQDRNFTDAGQLDFAIDDAGRGRLMETLTVNGTIDPHVDVASGLVRLRLLNGSQARIYELSVEGSTMVKIAGDGGYLPEPVELDTLWLAPGDRAEIVVDIGDEAVHLVDASFERVLELRPNGDSSETTSLPSQLATIDQIEDGEIDVDRRFVLEEVDEGWGINGMQMDRERIDQTIQFGSTERWTISATNGQHVFHVHQTQFQIVSINGEPPPPEDRGWEDSVWVNGDREVVIAARFDTYTNPNIPYMFHCHLLDHEDLGMMGQFQVVDSS